MLTVKKKREGSHSGSSHFIMLLGKEAVLAINNPNRSELEERSLSYSLAHVPVHRERK